VQIGESEREIFLKQFFIHSAHQRRGIGTRLLQDLLKRAAQAGKPVTLGVVKGNPARSLYERQGFQITSKDDYKVYMAFKP
jgi:ribosomal protein S18 acetylase RimI-like enzyme